MCSVSNTLSFSHQPIKCQPADIMFVHLELKLIVHMYVHTNELYVCACVCVTLCVCMCMKEILLDTSRTVERTKLIRYSSELYLFRMTDMLLDHNLYMYWCVVHGGGLVRTSDSQSR